MTDTSLHTKYRPSSLEDVIGHDSAVKQLKALVASEKIPGAMLFTGPSSVGKTTLARAFAVSVNGKPIEEQRNDVVEINAGETRTIDDMRLLISKAKFMPSAKRRFIIIDEAQQLLSSPAAAAALLLPVEAAGKTKTTWIFCSMDPEKFKSGNGKAIANRCMQFNLEPPNDANLMKQAIRIAKGEGMNSYLTKETLGKVVEACNGEMRTLANLLQGVQAYAQEEGEGKLSVEEVTKILKTSESNDDALVVDVVVGVLTGKYAQVHKALLDVAEPYAFINKLQYASAFLLSNAVLDGARHPKVWWTNTNKTLVAKLKPAKVTLGAYAALNEAVVNLKGQASGFAVDEVSLISARMYRLIKDLFAK